MDMQVGTVWRAALITAVGGSVAALSGALIAGAGNDVGRGYVMRVAVITAVLIATVIILAGRSVRLRQRHTFAGSVLAGSAIGFLLDPATWAGRAYVAQLFLAPGLLTGALDVLVLLVLTGTLTVTLGARLVRPERRDRSFQGNSYLGEGSRS